jgi:hypothetical protein
MTKFQILQQHSLTISTSRTRIVESDKYNLNNEFLKFRGKSKYSMDVTDMIENLRIQNLKLIVVIVYYDRKEPHGSCMIT